ncbi:MAG: ATP-binding protein [Bacteroidales bacterium]|nr:ATP-binding protein [Lentimicrobiaceae bacterium]MDD5696063.1 ATP-binding protein [Bacteroidales bacterium]
MITRVLTDSITESLKPGQVTGLFGARRTGKTFLMQYIKTQLDNRRILMVNGENLDVAEILSSQRLSILRSFLAGYDYLFIDEAQKIPGIEINLKLLVDSIPEVIVFVTGSSGFDLKNKLGEPLTGRSKYFHLYPVAQLELEEDYLKAKENLETRLIYGSYPQVVVAVNDPQRKDVLESIKNGFLLKDIMALDNLKDSLFIMNLLRLIAFQIGNDVSHHELSKSLGVSKNTVARYLDLLEKCFIIFSLQGFSRNLRNEITKSKRYFFWDNGVRNVVISNFNRLSLRDDTGKLWENYCICERMKRNHYLAKGCNYYFWRTYQQKEIDLIEESGGKLSGSEFKWKEKPAKPPAEFLNTYTGSSFQVIHNTNYLEFIQ